VTQRALTQDRAALASQLERARLLEEQLDECGVDEDRLELAQAYGELGRLHTRVRELEAATRAYEKPMIEPSPATRRQLPSGAPGQS